MIGGAAGAVPVLVGWAAVTGSLSWTPVVLFAIIFMWTPPHFWALAVRYRDDYAAADVPMLPVVASLRRTTARDPRLHGRPRRRCPLLFACGRPAWGSSTGGRGAASARRSSSWPRGCGPARTGRPRDGAEAMRLFGYSITYLTVLFVAMAVDVFVRAR